MKLVLLIVLGTVATIADQAPNAPIAILKYVNDGPNVDGSYKWSFETANEIQAEEQGRIKNAEDSDGGIAEVSGKYSYTAPDGRRIETTYIANENGFQPKGDHIPTTPEVPRAVQKLIEFVRLESERSLERSGKNGEVGGENRGELDGQRGADGQRGRENVDERVESERTLESVRGRGAEVGQVNQGGVVPAPAESQQKFTYRVNPRFFRKY